MTVPLSSTSECKLSNIEKVDIILPRFYHIRMSNTGTKTRDMAFIALGAVVIIVCSWISIPTVVPFTLQTFAVFFLLSLLGGKRATFSILIYILLGAVGVPVFSGFKGGFGVLAGPTGGYVFGFILMGILYMLCEKLFGRRMKKLPVSLLTMLIGLVICYVFGTAWFILVYAGPSGGVGIGAALAMCVFPFIIPDLVKMALAVVLSSRIEKQFPRG